MFTQIFYHYHVFFESQDIVYNIDIITLTIFL